MAIFAANASRDIEARMNNRSDRVLEQKMEAKMTKDVIVYDVEVLRGPDEVDGGWDNPEAMGFASAVAYSYRQDQYFFFMEEKGRLALLDVLRGNFVVTFNGVKFDSRVMLGNDRGVIQRKGKHSLIQQGEEIIENHWTDCDLLLAYISARFGYENVGDAEKRLGDRAIHDGSFSLDGLAEGTLGMRKTGHGAKAPLLYRDGKIAELLAYNLHDVRLTKKLYDFAKAWGYVIDRAGRQVKISNECLQYL